MVDRGCGVIINISSQMPFVGARDRSVYASTKLAIAQFTKTAALEWGPRGVRVNCIAPGRTVTAINRDVLGIPSAKLSIVLLTNHQNVGTNARGTFTNVGPLDQAVARAILGAP